MSPRYPARLDSSSGDRAPAALWFAGDLSLLQTPCLSLVGSRELKGEARAFARRAGEKWPVRAIPWCQGEPGDGTGKGRLPGRWRPGDCRLSGAPGRRLSPICFCAGRIASICPFLRHGPYPATGSFISWGRRPWLPRRPRGLAVHGTGRRKTCGGDGVRCFSLTTARRGTGPHRAGATAVGMSQLKHLSALFPAQTTFF